MVWQCVHMRNAGSFFPSLFDIVSWTFHSPPRKRWISCMSVVDNLSARLRLAVGVSIGLFGGLAAFTKYPLCVVARPILALLISVPCMMN